MDIRSKVTSFLIRSGKVAFYFFLVAGTLGSMVVLGAETVTKVFTILFFVAPLLGGIAYLLSWNRQSIADSLPQVEPEHIRIFSGKLAAIVIALMAFYNLSFGVGSAFNVVPGRAFLIALGVQIVYYSLLFVLIEGITEYFNDDWPNQESPWLVKVLRMEAEERKEAEEEVEI